MRHPGAYEFRKAKVLWQAELPAGTPARRRQLRLRSRSEQAGREGKGGVRGRESGQRQQEEEKWSGYEGIAVK